MADRSERQSSESAFPARTYNEIVCVVGHAQKHLRCLTPNNAWSDFDVTRRLDSSKRVLNDLMRRPLEGFLEVERGGPRRAPNRRQLRRADNTQLSVSQLRFLECEAQRGV